MEIFFMVFVVSFVMGMVTGAVIATNVIRKLYYSAQDPIFEPKAKPVRRRR
jgi:hypothetical protein